jgi:hypothetical protein
MDNAAEVAKETAVRVGRGYLNGTTRGQAYGILLVTATLSAVSGAGGMLYHLKKKYNFQPKTVKVPVEHAPDRFSEGGVIRPL